MASITSITVKNGSDVDSVFEAVSGQSAQSPSTWFYKGIGPAGIRAGYVPFTLSLRDTSLQRATAKLVYPILYAAPASGDLPAGTKAIPWSMEKEAILKLDLTFPSEYTEAQKADALVLFANLLLSSPVKTAISQSTPIV